MKKMFLLKNSKLRKIQEIEILVDIINLVITRKRGNPIKRINLTKRKYCQTYLQRLPLEPKNRGCC
jgi:hypothetical protein